jgi:hypothetical protein
MEHDRGVAQISALDLLQNGQAGAERDIPLLDARVDRFVEFFAVDPAVARALRPSTIPEMKTGLPDTDAEAAAMFEKGAARQLEGTFLYGGHLLKGLPVGGAAGSRRSSREVTRRNERLERQQRSGPDWDDKTNIGMLGDVVNNKQSGLLVYPTSYVDLKMLWVSYSFLQAAPEYGGPPEPLINAVPVLGEVELVEEMINTSTSADLLARHFARTDQAGLDVRLGRTLAIAAFNDGYCALETMDLLCYFDLQCQSAARSIARHYENALFSNDVADKMPLLADIATLARTAAARARHPNAKVMFETLAESTDYKAGHSAAVVAFVGSIYKALGQNTPQALKWLDPAPQVAPQVIEVQITEPKLTEQLAAEITNQAAGLTANAEAFRARWRMTTKARKAQGFEELSKAFMHGIKDPAEPDSLLIQPIDDKPFTQETTDILVRLHGMASANAAQAGAIIDNSLSEEQALAGRRQALQEVLTELGHEARQLIVSLPDVLPLSRRLEWLRAHWPGVRQALHETWPRYEGAAAAERIAGILFAPAAAD